MIMQLLKDFRVVVTAAFILVVIVMAVFAPQVVLNDPAQIDASTRFLAPGGEFPLGTDQFGRGILSRVIMGARLSVIVSVVSVTLAMTAGVAIGTVAAYFGGWLDTMFMRSMDAVLSFPPILLAIFVVSFFGSSMTNVIIVIAVLYTPRFARISYAATTSVKESEFVQAEKAMGASVPRILAVAVLPNIIAPVVVQFSLGLGRAILLESGLSFLGLGPPPRIASWGRMIDEASRFMSVSPYGVIWPSIVISLTVLAFNLLGDALRDHLDPRVSAERG